MAVVVLADREDVGVRLRTQEARDPACDVVHQRSVTPAELAVACRLPRVVVAGPEPARCTAAAAGISTVARVDRKIQTHAEHSRARADIVLLVLFYVLKLSVHTYIVNVIDSTIHVDNNYNPHGAGAIAPLRREPCWGSSAPPFAGGVPRAQQAVAGVGTARGGGVNHTPCRQRGVHACTHHSV